jgi:membrane fusion protein (multidrug efflux system)
MTQQINPNAAAPAGAPVNKRKRALTILALVVVVAALAWAAYYFLVARWHEDTDDAYVLGNVVSITPQTQGTVVSIGADDGMKVVAGQVLVQLDPNDARVAYEQAEANLANAVRQARGLYSAVEANQADIAARRVAVEQAKQDVARRAGLVATGAVAAEELAHARDELAAAQAALAGSNENLSRNRALVDATTVQTQPQVAAAAAQLRQAYLNLQRMAIVAPVTGYVAKRSTQLGQRVQPGVTLMTVVPLEQVWVEANFKETQLANMRIGQPVELHSDLYGKDVRFDGHLVSLGLGTGSAFALLPAQNASGNWIKIVQRVPVRISVDTEQLKEHPLRLGLSMHTDVSIRDRSGPLLADAPPAKPLLTTNAYAKQLADANARIAKIVEANLGRRG